MSQGNELELVAPDRRVEVPTEPDGAILRRLEDTGVLPRGFARREAVRARSALRTRAAQYVRMSTEHQQYSTANQRDAIAAYAAQHRFEIVRTFADDGRSGLTLSGRQGLRDMLAAVVGGTADFGTILVYDVSRWGRFQDPDESAYYEFLCRREGVHIEYCAEPFRNDGTATSSLMKNIKRMMAGEFSRELSHKVFVGKCAVSRKGLHVGGAPGYGLRRLLLDSAGRKRGVLQDGEEKFSSTDRVILVPGPRREIRVVRWVFKQVVQQGTKPETIAERLNARAEPWRLERPWNRRVIEDMLTNEKYVGNMVYNKRCVKLKTTRVFNPPEQWIRVEGAYKPVVDRELFWQAQCRMRAWTRRIDHDTALVKLRELLDREGKLTSDLIDATPDMPGCDYYRDHFGGITRAYALVGYRPGRDPTWQEGYGHRERLLAAFRRRVADELVARGAGVDTESGVVLKIGGALRLGVLFARFKPCKGLPRWLAQIHVEPQPDWLLIARLRPGEAEIQDYCLIRGGMPGIWLGAKHRIRGFEERYEAEVEPLLQVLVSLVESAHVRQLGARADQPPR